MKRQSKQPDIGVAEKTAMAMMFVIVAAVIMVLLEVAVVIQDASCAGLAGILAICAWRAFR